MQNRRRAASTTVAEKFRLSCNANSHKVKPTFEYAASVLTLAFSTDPPVRWMYRDSCQYVTCFPKFVKALAGRALEHGTIDSLEGCPAVAFWLPAGVQPDEQALIAFAKQSVSEALQEDMFALFEKMGSSHPAEPHWYLPLIGVDPAWHGAGYGSELLKRGLARCDSDRVPAYLEATTPRNRSLYERLGFEQIVEHGLFEKVHYRLDPLKYIICEHSQNLVDTNGRYHYCYHYIHGKSD